MLTFEDIRNNIQIRTYIEKADEALGAIGYTEHSFAHVTKVAETAADILIKLGYSEHEAELARIAGYMHDIGNVINRVGHAQSGASMAFRLLDHMGAEEADVATIISAIGYHDDSTAYPVNPVAAALILADKTDVRRSRVRNKDQIDFDIHDRVNYAAYCTQTHISDDHKKFTLSVEIDTAISAVMDYFEIFLDRMLLCRRASEFLGMRFGLTINGQEVL